jgi:hypothetical protein
MGRVAADDENGGVVGIGTDDLDTSYAEAH